MMRLLALLLIAASPAWTQEAEPEPAAAAASPGLEVPAPADAAEETPMDPVAAWESDRTAILPADGVDLGAFEYVARPLVIFGDSPRQPQVIEQLRLIESGIGDLAGRDVVVILDTDPEARSTVRQELRPRGFSLVLIDKDGRVTMRRPAPIPVREIARAIDRTPIRQEELRNGGG